MHTSRRKFITTSLTVGLAAALPGSAIGTNSKQGIETTYAKLDEILQKPVLKRELFTAPVIIESLELLRYKVSIRPTHLDS